jgi:hypothetical protein
MTEDEFSNAVRDRLFPTPYSFEVPAAGTGFSLLLKGGAYVPGWPSYVLAIKTWSDDALDEAWRATVRRDIQRLCAPLAPKLFVRAALYLVLCGSESRWGPIEHSVSADLTNFAAMGLYYRPVTIQYIHLVDPFLRRQRLKKSRNLALRVFGTPRGVSNKLISLLAPELH